MEEFLSVWTKNCLCWSEVRTQSGSSWAAHSCPSAGTEPRPCWSLHRLCPNAPTLNESQTPAGTPRLCMHLQIWRERQKGLLYLTSKCMEHFVKLPSGPVGWLGWGAWCTSSLSPTSGAGMHVGQGDLLHKVVLWPPHTCYRVMAHTSPHTQYMLFKNNSTFLLARFCY